jgi:hypothetical protein
MAKTERPGRIYSRPETPLGISLTWQAITLGDHVASRLADK